MLPMLPTQTSGNNSYYIYMTTLSYKPLHCNT